MLNLVLFCVETFKPVSSTVHSLYKELHFPGSSELLVDTIYMNMEGYDRDMEEALELMKCKLPEYLVNCLVAAGYDTISVISKIDDDSLQEIESFIAETFPDDMKYMHSSSTRNCRFPPGHVKKLKMFVEELQSLKKSCQKHKRPVPMFAPASKKICPSSDEQSNEDSIFPEEVVSCARRCVSKWQRSQRDVNIKKLKEHVDFEIKTSSKDTPTILCKLCGKSYTLAYKKGMLLVSNWSRHVTQCAKFVANNRQQVLCFSSRSSSEPTPTLSPDRVSIDLTTV